MGLQLTALYPRPRDILSHVAQQCFVVQCISFHIPLSAKCNKICLGRKEGPFLSWDGTQYCAVRRYYPMRTWKHRLCKPAPRLVRARCWVRLQLDCGIDVECE